MKPKLRSQLNIASLALGAPNMAPQLSNASGGDRPVAAVFDFDGTLTTRDSLFPFLRFYSGWPTFARKVVRLSPLLLG